MRRILFILFAVIISACSNTEEDKTFELNKTRVENFEYNGHRYLRFWFSMHSLPAVHDPDCPCLKREKNMNNNDYLDGYNDAINKAKEWLKEHIHEAKYVKYDLYGEPYEEESYLECDYDTMSEFLYNLDNSIKDGI